MIDAWIHGLSDPWNQWSNKGSPAQLMTFLTANANIPSECSQFCVLRHSGG
jgi:hypothetical protein